MTYKCAFEPSKTNGHWHLTQEEAQRCMLSWERWNKPKPKKNLFNNIPNGGQTPDMDSRSYL